MLRTNQDEVGKRLAETRAPARVQKQITDAFPARLLARAYSLNCVQHESE